MRRCAFYCRRTVTLSVAPRASITVSRTKPGPSGWKNTDAPPALRRQRHAVDHDGQRAAPPEILSATGSGCVRWRARDARRWAGT